MNSLTTPKISVLLSVYNGGQTIEQAVRSILTQTFEDFELIVINDGSTDSTFSLLEKFQDSRVVIQNISQRGLTKALNAGLARCRGEFVARIDADDIALPNRFEQQVAFLNKHQTVGMVGTGYEVLTENGLRKQATVPLLETDSEIKQVLPKLNPFHHGSVMIRRQILSEAGGYDESFKLAQDYELWLRLSKRCQMANIGEVLMVRREGRETLKKERKQNWYGIKARMKAIREGNLSSWNVIYIFRPLLVVITPDWIKSVIRKLIRNA